MIGWVKGILADFGLGFGWGGEYFDHRIVGETIHLDPGNHAIFGFFRVTDGFYRHQWLVGRAVKSEFAFA